MEEGEVRPPCPPVAVFLDRKGVGPSEQGGRGEPPFKVDLVRLAESFLGVQYAVIVNRPRVSSARGARAGTASGRRRWGIFTCTPTPRRGRSTSSERRRR